MIQPPIKPAESDCCNSGCNPCIFDVYEKQLTKWRRQQQQRANGAKFESSTLNNCISPTSFTAFRLIARRQHTPNTCLFTFKYIQATTDNANILSYHPGQYFMLKYGDDCTRAYTPLGGTFQDGANPDEFTVLVRLYDKGRMTSTYLKQLEIGAHALWRGPYGSFRLRHHDVKHYVFVAQGTGIAPIHAVLAALLADEDCECFLKLFFCCGDACASNTNEILLRDQLYAFGAHWNFSCTIFIDNGVVSSKYNETIVTRRLGFDDLRDYYGRIDLMATNTVICGSERFGDVIRDYVEKCYEGGSNVAETKSNHIHVF